MNCPENDLINAVIPLLKEKFPNYKQYEEMAMWSRTPDMVLFDGKIIMSIEFKISAWRTAVKQARDHSAVADYAYICMPKKKYSQEFYDLLIKYGLGLLLFDKTNNILIEKQTPTINQIWEIIRIKMMEKIAGREKKLRPKIIITGGQNE